MNNQIISAYRRMDRLRVSITGIEIKDKSE
jgi:hypothetical protein